MPVSRTATQQTPRSTTYRLHEFDPSSYDWDDWEILFDTYTDVEGITDDTKKRNLLITALSVQPFKTLISICKPKKPNECSFQEILQKLRTNYTRVTFSSIESIKFFATRQDSSQTLTDFANGLRDNTVTCNFPADFYEQALITAFVGGLRNEHVRQHLMQQNLETFEQTRKVFFRNSYAIVSNFYQNVFIHIVIAANRFAIFITVFNRVNHKVSNDLTYLFFVGINKEWFI